MQFLLDLLLASNGIIPTMYLINQLLPLIPSSSIRHTRDLAWSTWLNLTPEPDLFGSKFLRMVMMPLPRNFASTSSELTRESLKPRSPQTSPLETTSFDLNLLLFMKALNSVVLNPTFTALKSQLVDLDLPSLQLTWFHSPELTKLTMLASTSTSTMDSRNIPSLGLLFIPPLP